MPFSAPSTLSTISRFITLAIFLLLITFPHDLMSCAVKIQDMFVIGEVPKPDTERPVFQIHLPRLGEFKTNFHPSNARLPPGMTTMRMVTARGQVMRCVLPDVTSPYSRRRTSASSSPLATPSGKSSEETRFDDIDDILSVYENKCFLREEGWWTYEFCYGRHVVQKHIIPPNRHPDEGEQEVENVLGKLNKQADLQRRKNASLVSMPDAAFTQLFENGTECDLNGQPRRTIVKYVCSEDTLELAVAAGASGAHESNPSKRSGLNVLNNIRELESCVYEVEFLNSAICQHATYMEKAANAVRPIHCSVEEGEGPFEGLHSDTYHRSSLSL